MPTISQARAKPSNRIVAVKKFLILKILRNFNNYIIVIHELTINNIGKIEIENFETRDSKHRNGFQAKTGNWNYDEKNGSCLNGPSWLATPRFIEKAPQFWFQFLPPILVSIIISFFKAKFSKHKFQKFLPKWLFWKIMKSKFFIKNSNFQIKQNTKFDYLVTRYSSL